MSIELSFALLLVLEALPFFLVPNRRVRDTSNDPAIQIPIDISGVPPKMIDAYVAKVREGYVR